LFLDNVTLSNIVDDIGFKDTNSFFISCTYDTNRYFMLKTLTLLDFEDHSKILFIL